MSNTQLIKYWRGIAEQEFDSQRQYVFEDDRESYIQFRIGSIMHVWKTYKSYERIMKCESDGFTPVSRMHQPMNIDLREGAD